MKKGTIMAIQGNLYEYDRYDERLRLHFVSEVDIDEMGHLTATYVPQAFNDEKIKDKATNFTKEQWYGIVEHFVRQDNDDLTDDEVNSATEDIVERCFSYGIPNIEDLPEYIAEYFDR